jgi:hypothetical protein
MSWRYQKGILVLPRVRPNLSRSGGERVDRRAWRACGLDGAGRRYVNLGWPGTGLSWRTYERWRKVQPMVRPAPCELCQPGHGGPGTPDPLAGRAP